MTRTFGHRVQGGLTLIELMTVVAVVSVLVAVAVPAYQGYQVRSKIAEAITMADPILQAVAAYYMASDASWPGNNEEAGLDVPVEYQTGYVADIEVQPDGFVVVTLDIEGIAPGTTIEWEGLAAYGNVEWDCSGGTLSAEYRPAECR